MIEVYAMVVFRERQPMNSTAERYLSELRSHARSHAIEGRKDEAKIYRNDVRVLEKEAEEITYHFCRVRLVQPPQKGAKVPPPRWEVVRDFMREEPPNPISPLDRLRPLYEDKYRNYARRAEGRAMTLTQFTRLDFNDPYGDCGFWGVDGGYLKMHPLVTEIEVPDYPAEWERMFKGERIDEDKLDPLPYLPYRHPIEDRKVQLRQIRFLYPETRTMPMPFALDYVRDRL